MSFRMAEFVYNSINNLSEGRTVKQAIKKLGLNGFAEAIFSFKCSLTRLTVTETFFPD